MAQPQDNARFFLLIVLLFWLFSSSDNGASIISAASVNEERVARQRQALGLLNSTRWGDFSPRLVGDADPPLSSPTQTTSGPDVDDADPAATQKEAPYRYLELAGFRKNDGYAWDDLGLFRNRCLEWSHNANGPPHRDGSYGRDEGRAIPVWRNATGVMSGEWTRRPGTVLRPVTTYNLSQITPHMSWLGAHSEWHRNVTGDHGKMMIQLIERDDEAELENFSGPGASSPVPGRLVRQVSGVVTMQDEASGASSWDMRLHGVHWPESGVVMLTSTSDKFAGIFGLPHLTPGPDFFLSSQKLLGETLDKVLQNKEKSRLSELVNPWTSIMEGPGNNWAPSLHCEYVVYMQIHHVDPHRLGLDDYGEYGRERLVQLVQKIEGELRNPTGAPVPGVPGIRASVVAWSPDCSFYLESKGPPLFAPDAGQHLTGMKEEVLIYNAKMWMLFLAGLMYAQVQLLKAQLTESSTPSTLGRVSFYTAGIMLLADALVFTSAMTWSLTSSSTLLPSLVLSFSAFMSMSIGSVFTSEVYKSQQSERTNRERQQASSQTRNVEAPRPGQARPVDTAEPQQALPSPPVMVPLHQDVDAEIAENAGVGAAALDTVPPTNTITSDTANGPIQRITPFTSITGRFFLLGTFILFLSLAATSWPSQIRNVYVDLLAFLYLSLWAPQIWRNVQRNSRRAFSWRFSWGHSALRLCPFAYFYCYEDNFLFAAPDRRAFLVLVAWVWVQLCALTLQDVLGPRFGVPKSWVPDAWDYHPVISEENLEAGGLPIGLFTGGGGGADTSDDNGDDDGNVLDRQRGRSVSLGGARPSYKDQGRNLTGREGGGTYTRCVDCAICREVLDVPVVRNSAEGSGGMVGLVLRRAYMVTPCRHIFHATCLEGWLRYRLQCPICRDELPPL